MLVLGPAAEICVCIGGFGAGPLIRNIPCSPSGGRLSPDLAGCRWGPALTQRGQHGNGHQEQGQEEVKNPHGGVQRQVLLAAAAARA